MKDKLKRILALIGAIIMIALVIATAVFGFMGNPLFVPLLFSTMGLSVLLMVMVKFIPMFFEDKNGDS